MSQSDREILQQFLSYNPTTGHFYWRAPTPRHNQRENERAGYVSGSGRRLITVRGKSFRSDHVAWLFVHGSWPKKELKHRNEDLLDDRIENLEESVHKCRQVYVLPLALRHQ